eukprot:CAMPEP_0114576036 /NCGR_PEP_ID=MMETSP0125-20121206/836_1 /TAXON_ID=485358 ORGANISM="Aristerostoma sp., Strain ATCC 50986" /NCGR_SAMPLE_ID=MMETSP0125 /ASSEMBLY_ACC=CAM_ASM_000245 /LENGTH=32 /DNA_ID= /DNA_START= /DNA_END= /DNA_ORIENTATION=
MANFMEKERLGTQMGTFILAILGMGRCMEMGI